MPSAVRALRKARGWTQSRLAIEAGLHRSQVSRLERGLRTWDNTYGAVLHAFGFTYGVDLDAAARGLTTTRRTEKTCARCRRQLPASAFRENPALRDGLDSWCRSCHANATAAWRADRGAELLRERRETYAADREAINERRRERYARRFLRNVDG